MTDPIRVRWIPYRRLPPNTKLVTRRTKWGNPFKLIKHGGKYTRRESLKKYSVYVLEMLKNDPYWLDPLFGYNLACSCLTEGELIQKHIEYEFPHCHADILLINIVRIRYERTKSSFIPEPKTDTMKDFFKEYGF